MSLTDSADLIEAIQVQLSSSSTLLTDPGYEAVAESTIQELGWSFPITTDLKIYWAIKRGVRHALFILWVASAQKFKFKQVNLQHRFDHYGTLLREMDKEFEKAMESNPAVFSGVDTYKMFGTKLDAGFAYDGMGRDVTHYKDNYVNFTPLESS